MFFIVLQNIKTQSSYCQLMLQFEIHSIFCFQLMYNINIFKNMTFFINIGQKIGILVLLPEG